MRIACMLVVFAIVVSAAHACLNDRDTSKSEFERLPAVKDIIAGKFDRYPAQYFEARLAVLGGTINSAAGFDPRLLDDAAVACDRLGRHDEAIEWMEKKRGMIASLDPNDPQVREAWYRYHANIGTHWVHRWAKRGSRLDEIGDVKTARDHIYEAVLINPNAHYGREKYQLQALETILSERLPAADLKDRERSLTPIIPPPKDREQARDQVRGLCGLIVLGNAWQSVDVFRALSKALMVAEEKTLAVEAMLRAREIALAGGRSLFSTATKQDLVMELIDNDIEERLVGESGERIQANARRSRQDADAWSQERTAAILAELNTGSHPDRDPRFWNRVNAVVPPSSVAESAEGIALDFSDPGRERARAHREPAQRGYLLGGGAIGLVLLLFAGSKIVEHKRRLSSAQKLQVSGVSETL